MTRSLGRTCSPALIGALVLTMAPLPAQAANPLEAVIKCRAITDSTARLACFDQASSVAADLVAHKEVQVLDTETIRQTRRSLFGFYLPRVPLFGGDKPEEQIDAIDVTVTRIREIDSTQIELHMEDQSVWRTTEAPDWGPPKPGSIVHIKRGMMGSYFLTFKGQRPVRGIRVG